MMTSILEIVAPGSVRISTESLEELRTGEVRVEVYACGICHSDLGLLTSPSERAGKRLGHEVSGTVAASRSDRFVVGDRVVACVGNGFATSIDVSEDDLVMVPDGVSLLAATLAEPMACVLAGLDRVDLSGATEAAVVGSGFMGLLLVRALVLRGIAVDAFDISPSALTAARQQGARKANNPSNPTSEARYHLVFECTGTQRGLAVASEMVAVEGTLSIVGYHQSDSGVRTVPMRSWNFRAIDVINAHTRSSTRVRAYVERALVTFAVHAIDIESFVTDLVDFDELPRLMNRLTPGGPLRAGKTVSVMRPGPPRDSTSI